MVPIITRDGIEAFKGDACDGLPLRKMHVYEVRPRKDHGGFELISDTLPFDGLWYLEVSERNQLREIF